MGVLGNWLKRFKGNEWLGEYCDAEENNIIRRVLAECTGVGCHIEKNRDGRGWKWVIDGSSDSQPPPGYIAPWTPGYNEQFGIVKTESDVVQVRWGTWHRIEMTRSGASAPYNYYPVTETITAASTGDFNFGTSVMELGANNTITESVTWWLKLDWSSAPTVLTGHEETGILAAPAFTDEETYYILLGTIAFAGGAITTINQYWTGPQSTMDYGHPVECTNP